MISIACLQVTSASVAARTVSTMVGFLQHGRTPFCSFLIVFIDAPTHRHYTSIPEVRYLADCRAMVKRWCCEHIRDSKFTHSMLFLHIHYIPTMGSMGVCVFSRPSAEIGPGRGGGGVGRTRGPELTCKGYVCFGKD